MRSPRLAGPGANASSKNRRFERHPARLISARGHPVPPTPSIRAGFFLFLAAPFAWWLLLPPKNLERPMQLTGITRVLDADGKRIDALNGFEKVGAADVSAKLFVWNPQ